MEINKHEETELPRRAPLKREAPVLQGSDLNFDQNAGFHGGPSARRKGYRLALWSVLATFIDTLILISLSSAFIISFSLIVKTSVGHLLGGVSQDQHQLFYFAAVFFVFGWFYTITIRSFMGSTLGEWACDLRLGQPHERLQNGYILKVALRSTLILLTGVFPLPVFSIILGKDLPGMISGLNLFSLK